MQVPRQSDAAGRGFAARRCILLFLSGLALAATPSAAAWAQDRQAERPQPGDPYAAHIAEASLRFGIPANWIRAVLAVESAGDSRAVSPAGAMGLMQVMPQTWAALRARHRLGDDPFAPRDNVLAGTAYLREMHDRYGDVSAMLAAYNAGPGRYDEYLADGRALPSETRAYVALLAPALGGAPLPGGGFAAAPPPDWRQSPLFAGSMIARPDAVPLQSDGASDAAAPSPAPPADALSPVPAQELFMVRSGGDPDP
ncbi:lytic transglycosylase domain-containing protein [Plastorhodobacter daqingensis]|uniref:Lytic transglycosylase domain-containing protein n=1 Tax=Plastorhodobacter daqingensis TaxID=1387281 RepID=A0ABW2UTM7_9RHOB